MRDTVYCLTAPAEPEKIVQAVETMVSSVQAYVPGYRLKQGVQIERVGDNDPVRLPGVEGAFTGLKVSVFLEVEGAGHYLPAYAGNLDIRSEEHTSELQSLMRISYAVFCLKQKNKD